MATKSKKVPHLSERNGHKPTALDNVTDYQHGEAKRKNNLPAKLAAEGVVPLMAKIPYACSPRLSPVLRFDPTGGPDRVMEVLAKTKRRALKDDEVKLLADALRTHKPWLEWAEKREKRGFPGVPP